MLTKQRYQEDIESSVGESKGFGEVSQTLCTVTKLTEFGSNIHAETSTYMWPAVTSRVIKYIQEEENF